MAITENSKVLASDFIALKARVKAELSRRVRNGDISSYGGSNYDYTITPAANSKILVEHINKIVEPLNAVNSTGVSISTANISPIVNLTLLDAKLTTYEGDQMVYNGHNSCAASCSGMCVSTCWDSCTSCTGCSGCGFGCATTCSGCTGCSGCGSCGGACSSNCTGCSGGCSGCTGCSESCTDACSGCGHMCSSSCSGYCSATCTGGCAGCGSGCASGCDNTLTM